MTVNRLLFTFVLLTLVSSTLMAQPIVNIRLDPDPQNPDTPRKIVVTPNASAVCHAPPEAAPDTPEQSCPSKLTFNWVGQPGKPTEKIRVDYKDGLFWAEDGTPATVAPDRCFDFPEGKSSFEIEDGGRYVLSLKPGSTDCPQKVAFFFDISCQGGEGGNCGGVETLDPGTMVDNGNRNP